MHYVHNIALIKRNNWFAGILQSISMLNYMSQATVVN